MSKLSETLKHVGQTRRVLAGKLTPEQEKIRDLEAELMAAKDLFARERERANAAVLQYNVLFRRVSEAINHLAGPVQAPVQKPHKANDGG